MVVGYGFNDEHLETHLGQQIKSGKPTLLLTHSLTPNATSLVHNYSNVIALEAATLDGRPGTRIFVNKVQESLADKSIWDLENFVAEVLGT